MSILLYPFVFFKKKNEGELFFFFDRYVIGGAQKVHLDILESVSEQQKQIYFTRYSPNEGLKDAFYRLPNSISSDVHFYCDNLLIRLFSVHFFAFYVNRHKRAHIFSSNSTFFYDMLPFIDKKIIRTELLHNFTYGNNGMEHFGLANHQYLDNRMVIDSATKLNIRRQYAEHQIPSTYLERIRLIEPGVAIPTEINKDYNAPLKVLYAGRGGAQKRIYLLNQVAEHCITNNLAIEFHFAGTMMDELSELVKSNSVIHGEISAPNKMQQLYETCHALLMTSAYEGFPMLIKEGMAFCCLPIVTALEGNKTHLVHMSNALLIDQPKDEQQVVNTAIKHLELLLADRNLLQTLCIQSGRYARQHFDKADFIKKYKTFLEQN
ncbi:MAG TPA: glycosyltransferase [Flavipsychrobacter sp.]|nr:glycosyltransferase [Flavipsychrobacter sp.]